MITLGGGATKIYLATEPIDLRRGYGGLYTLVEQQFGAEPQSGNLWVFSNRRRNLLKIFWWDDGGMCVLGNTHAPHCALWFRCEDSLPLSPAIWKGDRSVRLGGRTAGVGICSIAG